MLEYDCTRTCLEQNKIQLGRRDDTIDLTQFLSINYPKLNQRLKKVILNGLLIGNHDTILAAYDPPFSDTDIARDNPLPLRFLANCATVELAY